jgi:hypothetical protein
MLSSELSTAAVVEDEMPKAKVQKKQYYGSGIKGKQHENDMNILRLEKFFEADKLQNEHESWRKIEKEVRHKKLIQYASRYIAENELGADDEACLILFFKECIENNKIQKVRDVDYDRKAGEIKNVPGLHYNRSERRFTIKHHDKRLSTTQNLPTKCLEV